MVAREAITRARSSAYGASRRAQPTQDLGQASRAVAPLAVTISGVKVPARSDLLLSLPPRFPLTACGPKGIVVRLRGIPEHG